MSPLYKILGAHGEAIHGGTGAWPLPANGQPGAWVEVFGPLRPCQTGLHLCRPEQLVHWLGPTIWLAEAEGKQLDDSDKVVVRKARLLRRCEGWTKQTARLFAVACARRALERERRAGREPDPRSWQALEVAERYAQGAASTQELAAARAAALIAAEAAAEAAWSAARASARSATWNAACSAALIAAEAAAEAAWIAARAAARSAARSAACSAALIAAEAAAEAAWSAARADARSAARAAASAERRWQTDQLMQILGGGDKADDARAD